MSTGRLHRGVCRLFVGLAAWCGVPAVDAVEVTEITWMVTDSALYAGQSASSRPIDAIIALLRHSAPQLRHRQQAANNRRGWQSVAAGDEVCLPMVIRTPDRDALAYFTSALLMPPLQLLVRTDRVANLPMAAPQVVDLPRLLAGHGLRGAFVNGRSYGVKVDALLAKHKANPALSFFTVGDGGTAIVSILDRDRADYTIEHDLIGVHRTAIGEARRLTALGIHGANDPVEVGVACPRTAWGLAAIRVVDAAIARPEALAALRDQLRRGLGPQSLQTYGAQIDEFFAQRARRPPP